MQYVYLLGLIIATIHDVLRDQLTTLSSSSNASLRHLISQMQPTVKLMIDGALVESKSKEWIDVINPATQDVVSRLPLATPEEFNTAVASAKAAFPSWRSTPVPHRARVMFKLQSLIRQHMDELAMSITTEQGKTLADARGDVFRGLGMFLSLLLSLSSFLYPHNFTNTHSSTTLSCRGCRILLRHRIRAHGRSGRKCCIRHRHV